VHKQEQKKIITIVILSIQVKYTPGGLAFLDGWGPLRYAATTAFCAFVYSDWTNDTSRKAKYHDFGVAQINYMLGNNPQSKSYVAGFGANPPINEHHRTGHSSWTDNIQQPANNRHILYGALVGGPDSGDNYQDNRQNYQQNEPACDYNAGFVGSLAKLYSQFGGAPLDNFPPMESKGLEFQVAASINSQGTSYNEIRALLDNMSGWPARAASHLSFRYFMNLTSILNNGYSLTDVIITMGYNQGGKISTLTPWNSGKHIYYVEISYEGIVIYPGGQSAFYRETQFRMGFSSGANTWHPQDDWSYKGLQTGTPVSTTFIPVYDQGKLIYGQEPPV